MAGLGIFGWKGWLVKTSFLAPCDPILRGGLAGLTGKEEVRPWERRPLFSGADWAGSKQGLDKPAPRDKHSITLSWVSLVRWVSSLLLVLVPPSGPQYVLQLRSGLCSSDKCWCLQVPEPHLTQLLPASHLLLERHK